MNKVDVQLDCKHYVQVPVNVRPSWGDQLSCKYDGLREVIGVHSHSWHVRCRKCRYSRWYGQDHAGATAAQHRHKGELSHIVECAYDRVTEDGKGSIFRQRFGR